jgi:Lrp/AsnC family transcriptional regulator, regulator for asnA, asnC and gidA
MDETDWTIIDMLLKDARTSYSEIGKRLGLRKDTIQRRVQKLTKLGILGTPISILDAKKCGFEGIVDFFIKIDTSNFNIKHEFKSLPFVLMIAETIGDYNLYLSSFFRNIDDINQIVSKLKSLPNIVSFEMFYYFNDIANPLIMPFISGNPSNSILYKIKSATPQWNKKQNDNTS